MPSTTQTLFVPLAAGLQTEITSKLLQPGAGVLALENMVAATTGEMSKRDGSSNLTIPATPVFPAGTALPSLYGLATYRSALVRLSVPGPNPLWSYLSHQNEWLNPGAASSTITSLFRGPIATSLTNLVSAATIASSVQTPDMGAVNAFALEAHEVFDLSTGASAGIVETIVDCESLKAVLVTSHDQAIRPKVVTVGRYLLCFYLSLTDFTVRVDLYDTSNISSGANGYILTSANFAGPNSLLEVSLRNPTTAMVAYTTSGGAVVGVDFVPSTAGITTYTFGTSGLSDWFATSAMGWVRDFGGSGKLALVTQDTASGVVMHWDIGAISAGLSLSAAEYVVDSSYVGKGTASSQSAGVWSVASYTTSTSSTGEFVVMYDYLATSNTALSVVYRGTRVGLTLTTGAPYWYGTSLVSKFYQPGDGGTYILASYSNSANPTTPQNTYFVCVDGIPQPVPQATVAPQAAGGVSGRSSSLTSVVVNPSTDFQMMAVASLVDLLYVAGNPLQLFGAQVLQIEALPQQDTSTSSPIEAFGSLIVPGSTLKAYDGKILAEAIFARRPEPPTLIATAAASGPTVTIAQNAADRLIGAPIQPIATTAGALSPVFPIYGLSDLVEGQAALTHAAADVVVVSGSSAQYVLSSFADRWGIPGNFDTAGLNRIFAGGTITVANSGLSANDGTFTITSISGGYPGATLLGINVAAGSHAAHALGPSTTITITSQNAGRFVLLAPGIVNPAADPTLASQLLVVTGPAANTGTFVLDATTPNGTVTIAGQVYTYLYSSASSTTMLPEMYGSLAPSMALQLADPTTANTLTITDASFDQTYVGAYFQINNALNPSNRQTVRILQVVDATHIVVSAPLDGVSILRNENLGATSAITYSVTPSSPLENGEHAYVAVYTALDANDRKWRSPPSLPATVTTDGTYGNVTAIVQNLHQTGRNCSVELYRAQTGVGGQFNLVATVGNNTQAPATIFNDVYPDAVIALQEELFTDGGILPGTPLPGVSLLALFQGRVWTVSPESPSSLCYSNPDDAGSSGGGDGLLFDTTDLSLDIIDQHGPITAIQSMDSALIVFKKDAVYAVTGVGPDGTGAGGGYQAQLIAAGVGCSNPRSIVLQVGAGVGVDGVWFESNSTRAGIFTVTRGLTVDYTGQGVRLFTGETIVAALVYPGLSQIRWYTISGRTLIWDWISKIWNTSTGQPCLSAVMYQDVPTYAPTGALTGCILQEIPGLYEEGADPGSGDYVPFQTKVASPWLSLAQLKGFERLRKIVGVGRTVGPHTLTVNLYADYDDTNLVGTYTATFDGTSPAWSWKIKPRVQKLSAVKIEVITSDPTMSGSGSAGAAFSGVTIEYTAKKGLAKLPDAAAMASS